MQTQQDHSVRIVALVNLQAMCESLSGVSHRFWVEKMTRSRVWVGYSNPDEHGAEHPMYAVYPAFPSLWPEDQENPRVVLDAMRIVNDQWDGEGWQAFMPLHECPVLFRDLDGHWTLTARNVGRSDEVRA